MFITISGEFSASPHGKEIPSPRMCVRGQLPLQIGSATYPRCGLLNQSGGAIGGTMLETQVALEREQHSCIGAEIT